ncbi:MAG: DNA recombination protein RmuC, partial [Calditrichaeota bacterium]|nr:DNA recombination protein RmuC [Calditrichota bacterium]
MTPLAYVIIFLLALVGLAAGYLVGRLHRQSRQEQQKDAFKALAGSVLAESTTEFLKLADEKFKALARQGDATLEEKKKLIDANLQEMGVTLKSLVEKSARLDEGLATSKEETEKLRSTADQLRQVLASPQQRGMWGERMVEDILNVMGLEEGINYKAQMTMSSGERPDYTFLLPKGKKVNLDVKFPIDQYERYLTAESDAWAEGAKKQFLSDVKNHVKDVASRGYIDPESGTVDYVMVFIPNESIYGFIHQNDPDLLDFA